MSVKLVPEEDLRAALRPYRPDATDFEAGIRARIDADVMSHEDEGSESQSPLLKVAATFLPWPLTTGGKLAGDGASLSSVAIGQKLLGYAALPAISLFLLVGAAILSAAKIHGLQKGNHPDMGGEEEMYDAVRRWWGRHNWSALSVFAAVVFLPMIGSTWLLFLLLLISFAALLCLLSGFAKLGVGSRLLIGQSCLMGLALLGQAMANASVGLRDIHFVDQKLISVALFGGTLILLPLVIGSTKYMAVGRLRKAYRWILGLLYPCVVIPMLAWFANPILWPVTPARIQQHVEAFEQDSFPFIAWRDWEIAASWTIEAGLDPDLSRARELLDREISEDQSFLPLVLGSAFRVGLVRPDQLQGLTRLEGMRRSLIPEQRFGQPQSITSLNQQAWVIYALDQNGQLSPKDRDFLEQRLLATLDEPVSETADVLETALRVTQLLDVIDRPIDRDRYRERVQAWLREFHGKKTYGYQIAGGFEQYEGVSASLQATSHAVELMKIYGVPDDLDLNWIRSYLRPLHHRSGSDKWIAAVTLDRLNGLPRVTGPTWLEILYYERSLIAAMVLVVLCVYATWSSPATGSPLKM